MEKRSCYINELHYKMGRRPLETKIFTVAGLTIVMPSLIFDDGVLYLSLNYTRMQC